jgi:hypothetical protein
MRLLHVGRRHALPKIPLPQLPSLQPLPISTQSFSLLPMLRTEPKELKMNHKKLRLEINRANSQHSTGPRTPAGKQRSSLNALRHGLTGQLVVMPSEDLEAYQRHVQSFTDEYHPQGPTEQHLVQAIADASWRLNRVAALETNILTMAAAHQPDSVDDALALAAAVESQSKALANLGLHTQRLSRQCERTVAQLRELQQTRKSQQERELDDLLDIIEMYESKGEPYNPAGDGFVFSQIEIDSAFLARNRRQLASQAYRRRAA